MTTKTSLFLFLAANLFAFILPATAQKAANLEVKRIEEYKRALDHLVDRRPEPDLVFADVAADSERAKWRRFGSTRSLDKFREKTETYTVAYNWKQKGRIVVSNFTLFSESGDWAKYVNHYFRADGTLAEAISELRTFYGDYIVIEDIFFDGKGRRLKRNIKYLDITTNKTKKPSEELIADNSVLNSVDYYKHTSKLPFARLLKTPKPDRAERRSSISMTINIGYNDDLRRRRSITRPQ